MSTLKVPCPCEEEFEVNHETERELTPQLITEILEGNFQAFTCPSCKNIVKTEFETHFSFGGKPIYYFADLERNHFLTGKLKLNANVHRVCFGYKELVEKVRILKNELDDRVIEILKYLYLQKTENSEKMELRFHDQKDDKLEFYVHGVKENEVGVTAVQKTFYEKVAALLSKPDEDWKLIAEPPYVSVEKVSFDLSV